MDFHGMSTDLYNFFVDWYNERSGKKPIVFMWSTIISFFIAGAVVLYSLPRAMNWIGGPVPTWYLLLLFAWMPFSFFGGAKYGIRLYHAMYRQQLFAALENDLRYNERLSEEEKNMLRNYLVYYLASGPTLRSLTGDI